MKRVVSIATLSAVAGFCALSPAAFAQTAECHALAASTFDKEHPAHVAGVAPDKIDAAKAVPACRKALAESPQDMRIKFQLARSLAAAKGDPAEIAKLYREAAEAGFPLAQFALGALLFRGEGATKSEAEGVTWIKKASDAGASPAMAFLGVLMEEGTGVPKNEKGASELYRKAAEAGDTDAMRFLGVSLETGKGIAKDEKAANDWYRKAADAGDAEAMRFLAMNLENGTGTAKNLADAAAWYRKSADAGNAAGMRKYGLLLEEGTGVQKDEKAANDWYRKAADAGDIFGMRWLAANLRDGKGAEKNKAEAEAWFDKANAASAESERWDPSRPLNKTNFINSPFARLGLRYDIVIWLQKKRFSDKHILAAADDQLALGYDVNDRNAIKDFAEIRKNDLKGANDFVKALLDYQQRLRNDKKLQELIKERDRLLHRKRQ